MLAIVLALAGVAAAPASDSKKAAEPFYRKYLVPGAPLDDKIVEQEKRVEAHPDDASLHNDLGNLLAERRFPGEAAEQYEIALKLDKKNFISAYNLGLVRETQGRAHDAIAAYQRSIKRKPGFPQSRFRLGRLYEHTNQAEPAVREYAAAFWIDPGLRDPKRNPLVVDCELIYLAALANYRQDIAVAAMADSNVYFDVDRFRKLPTNRSIGAKEVEGEAPPESVTPRDVGAPGAPGSAGASEPPRHAPRPLPAAGAPAAGAPPPGMLGSPAERPTPVPRRPQPPVRPQPAPSAAPASPAPVPGESVEPTPAPEAPPEAESAPEAEPS
jgi:hypothetical protein